MFVGPVLNREVITAPRRIRFYAARASYVAALLILVSTAWLLLTGSQLIRATGDLARFGGLVFQVLAPLQLVIAIFFSAIAAASAVALEKDRRTLELLLLTNLSNSELVLGKLFASILNALVLMLAAVPLFICLALFGSISYRQILLTFAVTVASALAAGSLGSTIALWRERTFQTLAMTTLALVAWVAGWEAVAQAAGSATWRGLPVAVWTEAFSPWRAMLAAMKPFDVSYATLGALETSTNLFILLAVGGGVLLNVIAIALVRVWNPTREVILPKVEEDSTISVGEIPVLKSRYVWDNPILWRELRTWAYGRKTLLIRAAYLLIWTAAASALHFYDRGQIELPGGPAGLLAPLFVLSLVLVNTQAVTAITSERDARAIDLLLVTDLTPKEIIFGKLGGALYNTKEMLILPGVLVVLLTVSGRLSVENCSYVLGSLAIVGLFVGVVGIHCGMNYANSRSAIAVSLGMVFFLFVGVATCMRIITAFSGSFEMQLTPFLAFMVGGGLGMYAALGWRNPSPAIGAASAIAPFATLYCITSFLLNAPLAVFLVLSTTYGFATASMLVPALYEFDVATGRTTALDE